mgnify:CR=1 FL=1
MWCQILSLNIWIQCIFLNNLIYCFCHFFVFLNFNYWFFCCLLEELLFLYFDRVKALRILFMIVSLCFFNVWKIFAWARTDALHIWTTTLIIIMILLKNITKPLKDILHFAISIGLLILKQIIFKNLTFILQLSYLNLQLVVLLKSLNLIFVLLFVIFNFNHLWLVL